VLVELLACDVEGKLEVKTQNLTTGGTSIGKMISPS
jgi:hypothetical protein